MNSGSFAAGELPTHQPVPQPVPVRAEHIASPTTSYHMQFEGFPGHVSNHIKLQNEKQASFSFREESDDATLPLPGKVPDWSPSSQAQSNERDSSGVDLTQSSISFIPLGRNPETERLRKQFAEKIAGLERPARLDLIGFGAGRASDTALVRYFASLQNEDMLNILKFADQLQPNLIVDIMASVSRRHPSLPIFNSPDWNTEPDPPSPGSPQDSPLSRITERPRHGHTLMNPRMRSKHSAIKKLQRRASTLSQMEVVDDDEVDDEAPPSTWPKAGHGLYAKLPPEDEDKSYLDEDDSNVAFAHFDKDQLLSMKTIIARG